MCFYNDDCDWIADVNDVTDGPAPEAGHCIECSAAIAVGDPCRSVHQQEHEDCQKCDETSDDADFDEDGNYVPCDGNHDYGETFDCLICESCCQILKAIEAHEIDAGCPPHARQPSLGRLWDETIEDTEALADYLKRAKELFPGIEARSRLFPKLMGVVTRLLPGVVEWEGEVDE